MTSSACDSSGQNRTVASRMFVVSFPHDFKCLRQFGSAPRSKQRWHVLNEDKCRPKPNGDGCEIDNEAISLVCPLAPPLNREALARRPPADKSKLTWDKSCFITNEARRELRCGAFPDVLAEIGLVCCACVRVQVSREYGCEAGPFQPKGKTTCPAEQISDGKLYFVYINHSDSADCTRIFRLIAAIEEEKDLEMGPVISPSISRLLNPVVWSATHSRSRCSATARANIGETAFPICLYLSSNGPSNVNVGGNP